MEDSRGIAPKVGQYPERLLAIPWFEILLHSRRPSRLAGIWKSHGEIHCVKADHNFNMSGRIVNFLRETKRLSFIVPIGPGELQRDGGKEAAMSEVESTLKFVFSFGQRQS
jgi:hypothetical protein